MPGTGLINIGGVGELSKPATVLIERISDAIGGVARPWQIKRVAEAEAEARIAHAESEIEVADLRLRAGHRFIAEQTRIQSNIEGITRKSVANLNEDASPEMLEDDWIVNFFGKCRDISDDEMQNIWARILAGEANHPGSFSRKTVNLVADIEKGDAEIFSEICRFVWVSHADSEVHPFIFAAKFDVYARHKMTYGNLIHLQSLGFITLGFDPIGTIDGRTGFTLAGLPQKAVFSYCNKEVELVLPDGRLYIGNVLFTKAGAELCAINDPQPIEEFFQCVYEQWAKADHITS